jgi:hypothetical protein
MNIFADGLENQLFFNPIAGIPALLLQISNLHSVHGIHRLP